MLPYLATEIYISMINTELIPGVGGEDCNSVENEK